MPYVDGKYTYLGIFTSLVISHKLVATILVGFKSFTAKISGKHQIGILLHPSQ